MEKYFPKIYDLNYENLVTNSEKEIKNLLKFCELEWDENCLNPEKNTESSKLLVTIKLDNQFIKLLKSIVIMIII